MVDTERRGRVLALLPPRPQRARLTVAMFERAENLANRGVPPADALHVAVAEDLRAGIMLTCDDRLLRTVSRLARLLTVRVANPLPWSKEMFDAPNP
jgi:predicted nucleic acid-binding protein